MTGVASGRGGGNGKVRSAPGNPAGADRHRGWFPADGRQGLVTESWAGTDRVFVCFCGACGWPGGMVLAARVIGPEAAG